MTFQKSIFGVIVNELENPQQLGLLQSVNLIIQLKVNVSCRVNYMRH